MTTFEEREAAYFSRQSSTYAKLLAGEPVDIRAELEHVKVMAHEVFNPQCNGDEHVDCYVIRGLGE